MVLKDISVLLFGLNDASLVPKSGKTLYRIEELLIVPSSANLVGQCVRLTLADLLRDRKTLDWLKRRGLSNKLHFKLPYGGGTFVAKEYLNSCFCNRKADRAATSTG